MRVLLLVISILALTLIPARTQNATADLVLKNGNIYTANDRASKAQAIAV